MKTSKLLLAAVALAAISTPAFADGVRRIVHPNGESTYIAEPDFRSSTVSHGATIGVYAGNRSFSSATESRREVRRNGYEMNNTNDRVVAPFHTGRGQSQ